MKIIGIDSSGLVASVAVYEDGKIIAEYSTNYKKTHSQTLLPMLDEIKNEIGLDLSQVDAIAVASGPGSYTGLRIGAASAKGMAYSLGKPIIAVPTLEGLAFNMWGTSDIVCPLMDARRQQVYTGLFEFNPELTCIYEQRAVEISEVIKEVNNLGRKVIFLGDGAIAYEELLKTEVKVPFVFAPAHRNFQSAASIVTLGAMYYEQGKAVKSEDFEPVYLRKSQAENEGPQDFRV